MQQFSAELGPNPLMLLLISRVQLYCDAIVAILSQIEGVRVSACVDGGDTAIEAVRSAAADVVLIDMSHQAAAALAVSILKEQAGTKILGFGVEDVAVQVVACAEAGLRGYVPADATVDDLARAARRIARGETICSAAMADSLFRHVGAVQSGPAAVDAALTWRQRQILHLIREGLSNKQIAKRLSLGSSTVKNHVHGLLGRLQVGRRGEAAALLDRRPHV